MKETLNWGDLRVLGRTDKGGRCGPCRDCWDVTVEAVSYLKH